MPKSLIKNISIRSYIIVLLIIILVMFLMGYFIINGIRSSYYKKQHSINVSKLCYNIGQALK
ncbi:MAG: hypothetical protein CVU87_05315 [Firmicutes bacterium HGW-Firmicutes-12]|jgi:cell division protein FtsX|nr:MAG: hypothetical protein CVU87_05315 [Firmicutes bacterium HGW-Firmicutes-12]